MVCVSSDRASVLPFNIPRAPAEGRNTSASYSGWAALIAPAIHLKLAASEHAFRRSIPVDELARQSALDRLAVVDTYPSPIIDRLVESTRNLFGTTGAAVTFLDHGRRWVKSAVGAGTADSARSDSFCDLAIESSGVFVVENTHQHPRLSASRGANEAVRFYAGYPIEAPSGHRVGVLCIMDVLPRKFGASDSALLRKLALQVQSELWS
jgi:GAF domain-containing protein